MTVGSTVKAKKPKLILPRVFIRGSLSSVSLKAFDAERFLPKSPKTKLVPSWVKSNSFVIKNEIDLNISCPT